MPITKEYLEEMLSRIHSKVRYTPRDKETLRMLYWRGVISETEYNEAVKRREEYEKRSTLAG